MDPDNGENQDDGVRESFVLLENLKIKTLVVPVHPIKKETFDHYVELLRKFSVVSMADLTPPDPARGVSAFHNQHFTSGYLYFDFVTRYNREHQSLEAIQMQNQVLGAIGIMHCGQCPDTRTAYKQFITTTQNYPTIMVTRCFGFDPTDNTVDNTKGLIMIPNVGQLGFYTSTMISDFASELLTAFGGLAKAIDTKTMISLPMVTANSLPTSYSLWNNSNSSHAVTIPLPVLSTSSSQRAIAPLDAASASGAASGGNVVIPSSASTAALTNSAVLASNASSAANSEQLEARIKRRTPARTQKLHGDLYLLSGRWSEALSLYSACLETMKSNSDYLWQAVTLENIAAARLQQLLEVAHITPLTVQHKEFFPTPLLFPPTAKQIFASPNIELRAFLAELPEKFREVVLLLAKSALPPVQNPYPLLSMITQLKLAELLSSMIKYDFMEPLLNGGGCNAWESPKSASTTVVEAVSSTLAAGISSGVLPPAGAPSGYTGNLVTRPVCKSDVSSWLMHCWSAGVELLSIVDQIWLIGKIVGNFNEIGYRRKHAFFLLQLSALLQSFLESNSLSKRTKVVYQKFVWALDGLVGLFGLRSGPGLPPAPMGDWLSLFDPQYPASNCWVELQLDVLEQCCALCRVLEDDWSRQKFAALLLRRVHPILPRERQVQLQKLLQRIGLNLLETSRVPKTEEDSSSVVSGYNFGLLILKSQTVVEQNDQLTLYLRSGPGATSDLTGASNDPFIYNPLAQHKSVSGGKPKGKFAAMEPIDVVCVFANPFKFDLDIQAVELCASSGDSQGVEIKTSPVSFTIPAETAELALTLTCVPRSQGTLCINSCKVRMLGGTINEIVPCLYSAVKRGGSLTWIPSPLVIDVVTEQPQLQLLSLTNDGQNAVFLGAGERRRVELQLKNVGSQPVRYCQLSILERHAVASKDDRAAGEQLTSAEVYERDVHDHLLRAAWVEELLKDTESSSRELLFRQPGIGGPLDVGELSPSETKTLCVELYGKLGVHGIDLCVEYATNVGSTFYVRKCSHSLLVTVEPALSLSHFDIMLYNDVTAKRAQFDSAGVEQQLVMVNSFPSQKAETASNNSTLCLLTFDLTNLSDVSLEVCLSVCRHGTDAVQRTNAVIGSNLTKQIMIAMPRLFFGHEQLVKPIPAPEHLQFVLGKTRKLDASAEALERTLFWYRELLLGGLLFPGLVQIRYKSVEECGIRSNEGRMLLREVKLSKHMLSVLSVDLLQAVPRVDCESCIAGEPFNVTWRVCSVDGVDSYTLFRVLVVQDLQNGSYVTDLEEQGLLLAGKPTQTLLPPISPNGFVEYTLPLCFQTSGIFHFIYHVEPRQPRPVIDSSFLSPSTQDSIFWGPEPFVVTVKD